MVGLAAALVSFAESSALMGELAGVSVDAKGVERTAEALGREIARDERDVVEPSPPRAPTMYLGMDGTGVPMRAAELAGRAGKRPDGSAGTREVKLVTVWTAEGLGQLLGGHRERRVVLGDGAPWIWNVADELFPGATEVVDLSHARQHLSDVATAIYGPVGDLRRQWARERHDELDEGRLDDLLAALGVHARTNDEARRCLDHVTANASRMRYAEFRAQGLCVSSGVVEAGCKVAIGTRLKRARDALDPGRGRRHHRPALLQAQRTLRGLLGTALTHGPRGWCPVRSSHRSDVHPGTPRCGPRSVAC